MADIQAPPAPTVLLSQAEIEAVVADLARRIAPMSTTRRWPPSC